MRHPKSLFLLLCLGIAAAGLLPAVETTFWQIGTFDDLLQGTLQGVSLTKEGQLRLAPEARAVFSPEETLALSLAADRNHNLYVGTGHQGKVFRVDSTEKGSLFFTAQEPDIFALAVGPDGALYVGSSPEGKIYQVTPDGKSKVFYEPKTKYIWALAFDNQGRLYAGTGDQGKILRIDAAGKGEVFFDSNQTHIMCLKLDWDGNILAGSVPNGLVYRITPQGKGFVLYQAPLPEVHDLAIDSRGRIYAATLGAAGGKGTPEFFMTSMPGGPIQTAAVTVTVEAGAGAPPSQAGKAQNPPQSEAPSGPSFNRPAPMALGFPTPGMPQGRGSLIQILPDSTAETLWSSNNESIFGLAVREDRVLFSTDSNGRIFELNPSRDGQKLTLLTETHESLATRLLLHGPDLYIATSNIAKLFRLESSTGREGTFESPVKDTKFISRWGLLAWRGDVPQGTTLEFFTHSGNSERPDKTWSDWAGPYKSPNGNAITSPPARYIQWKGVLRSTNSDSPTLDEVTISYLNQNLPPQIRSLNVSTAGERTGPAGLPSVPGVGQTGAITVSVGPPTGFGVSPTAPATVKTPTTLGWQADDPNGDPLIYSIYVRAADEQEWHLVKDRLKQTNYTLDSNTLADGKYVARLVVSDEESNPPATARKAELLSAPFWIDNTPPEVRAGKVTMSSDGAQVPFLVEDSISPLRAAEASMDGKEWRDLNSDDGITDSRSETFTVQMQNLAPGEHIVSLRAYDTAGNVGVGKAVVRLPLGAGPKR